LNIITTTRTFPTTTSVSEVRALGASFAGISIRASGTVKVALAGFAGTSLIIKVSAIVATTFSGLSIARIFTNHVSFGVLLEEAGSTFSAFITIASSTRRVGFVAAHASFISFFAGFAKLGHYALTVFVTVVAFTTITEAVSTLGGATQGFGVDFGIVVIVSTLGAGYIITILLTSLTIKVGVAGIANMLTISVDVSVLSSFNVTFLNAFAAVDEVIITIST